MPALITIEVEDFRMTDVGDLATTPFTVRNAGTTRFIDIMLTSTFPDSRIDAHIPRMLMQGESFTGSIIWTPPFDSEEGAQHGEIKVKAYSIGA